MASMQGKVSGIDVLYFGSLHAVRCLAFITPPGPDGKKQEIQVFTEEPKLQLALSVASLKGSDVEVSFEDAESGKGLTRVRMLDR